MKSFIITSVAIATLTFVAGAQAEETPQLESGLPKTAKACKKWAGRDQNRLGLCESLATCETEHSNSEWAWIDCTAEAEASYFESIGQDLPGEGPYVGQKLTVSTEEEDAHYDRKSGNHKGFQNAEQ